MTKNYDKKQMSSAQNSKENMEVTKKTEETSNNCISIFFSNIFNFFSSIMISFRIFIDVITDFFSSYFNVWIDYIFFPHYLSIWEKTARKFLFHEICTNFSRSLTSEWKIFYDKDLDYRYLIVYPFQSELNSKNINKNEIYENEDKNDECIKNLNSNGKKKEYLDDCHHIIFFKSHGTSIFSMADNFNLDLIAKNYKCVFYIFDYRSEYFDFNQNLTNKTKSGRLDVEQTDVCNKPCSKGIQECIEHISIVVQKISTIIQEKHNKKPILMGFSLGCAILTESTLKNQLFEKNHVQKIILIAPFFSLSRQLKETWLSWRFFKFVLQRCFKFENNKNVELLILKREKYDAENYSTDEIYGSSQYKMNISCMPDLKKNEKNSFIHSTSNEVVYDNLSKRIEKSSIIVRKNESEEDCSKIILSSGNEKHRMNRMTGRNEKTNNKISTFMHNLKKLNENFLILHGTSDTVISCKHSEELSQIANCKFVPVKWASHVGVMIDISTWTEIIKFLNL